MRILSQVTRTPPAPSHEALAHFEARLGFETDCWDVHYTMTGGAQDFVLLDVRSSELYEKGHIPGAIHLPHTQLNERTLEAYPKDTLFVVHCAGPHCNGADKAAARLARLARPVKLMIGGIEGWKDEGFELERGAGDPAAQAAETQTA
jgi:rhodanese-related sulfurtransferase